MGPCLCGDPYCGSCGNPSLAEFESFVDNILEFLSGCGLEVSEEEAEALDQYLRELSLYENDYAFVDRYIRSAVPYLIANEKGDRPMIMLKQLLKFGVEAFKEVTYPLFARLNKVEMAMEAEMDRQAREYMATRDLDG